MIQNKKMGKILGYVYTFLSIFLAIPVVLILLTWNTTPDQTLYPVKRAMEEVPRLVLRLDPKLAATYEVKITNRRFEEASKLIAYSNTLGLQELNKSLIESKTAVLSDGNANAKLELKNNLLIYKQKLEAQKIKLQTSQPPQTPLATKSNPTPSQPTTQNPPTPAQTREATTQITETETIIEEVIVEINKSPKTSNLAPSQTSADTPGTGSSSPDTSPPAALQPNKILRRTLVKTTKTVTTNPDGTTTVTYSTSSAVIDETPIK